MDQHPQTCDSPKLSQGSWEVGEEILKKKKKRITSIYSVLGMEHVIVKVCGSQRARQLVRLGSLLSARVSPESNSGLAVSAFTP